MSIGLRKESYPSDIAEIVPRTHMTSRVAALRLDPEPIELNEAIDCAQQMCLGYMPFERKLVEQSILLDSLLPHHRLPAAVVTCESQSIIPRPPLRFSTQSTQIGLKRSTRRCLVSTPEWSLVARVRLGHAPRRSSGAKPARP
jgi:hypothetical protein